MHGFPGKVQLVLNEECIILCCVFALHQYLAVQHDGNGEQQGVLYFAGGKQPVGYQVIFPFFQSFKLMSEGHLGG